MSVAHKGRKGVRASANAQSHFISYMFLFSSVQVGQSDMRPSLSSDMSGNKTDKSNDKGMSRTKVTNPFATHKSLINLSTRLNLFFSFLCPESEVF